MAKDKKLGSLFTPSLRIPEQEERAVLTVLRYATDAEDAAELLEMLGLIKPSEGLEQDHDCPARSALQTMRSRDATDRSGPDPAGAGAGG